MPTDSPAWGARLATSRSSAETPEPDDGCRSSSDEEAGGGFQRGRGQARAIRRFAAGERERRGARDDPPTQGIATYTGTARRI
jgi:hypothetical protein